ncbi:hypothetical protein ACSIJM_16555 [Vibrio parahaemolyticus]
MSLTIEEKINLKTFWISLYGPQANQWPVNADMFDLTYKLLEESKKCSDLIDMVPRPMAVGQSPMSWLSSEVRGRMLRTLRNNKEHYVLCVASIFENENSIRYEGLWLIERALWRRAYSAWRFS